NEANFCARCGKQLKQLEESESSIKYAGIWRRVFALIFDAIIWVLFAGTLLFLPPMPEGYYPLMGAFLAWMYSALLDSSSWQGTIGKKIMGIAICDVNGNRIS